MTVRFTTWEKYQLDYIERQLGKTLSVVEKCAIILRMGWRTL